MTDNQTPGFVFDNDSDLLNNRSSSQVPTRIGDKFIVVQGLRGGMAEVYICRAVQQKEYNEEEEEEEDFESLLALKTFQKEFFFNHVNRQAFINEVTLWLRLSGQPFVMPALSLYDDHERLYVVTPAVRSPRNRLLPEYLDLNRYPSLRDLLLSKPEAISTEDAVSYCLQIAIGMKSAQEKIPGLVHGDIKPENILLWNGFAHISDFGLSRVITDSNEGPYLESTWAYRAPETWNTETTIQSDVYAFGVMLFELIVGSLPFEGQSRDDWKAAHLQINVTVPESIPTAGLAQEVFQLALDCLRKKPDERPTGFGVVCDRLMELVTKYSLQRILVSIDGYYTIHSIMHIAYGQNSLAERVGGFLTLGDYAQALQELEGIPDEVFSAELWYVKGNTLSLLDRDEEAIICFEKALNDPEIGELKWRCLSDYALSLKHMRRFEESIAIYSSILRYAPESATHMAIINLATVYLEMGQHREVIPLLVPHLGKHPQFAEGWANLAEAYSRAVNYPEAKKAFSRAVAIQPTNTQILFNYARFALSKLRDPNLAEAVLETLYDLGYNSIDWFIEFQVCNLVLGKRDVFSQLMQMLKSQASSEEYAHFENIILSRANDLISTPKPSESDIKPHHQEVEVKHISQDVFRLVEKLAVDKYQDFEHYYPNGFHLPFINMRLYMPEATFSIDFYYPTGNSQYKYVFFLSLKELMNNPEFKQLNLMPRTLPLYFTKCPHCQLVILTNRDIGKKLNCRVCGMSHETIVTSDKGLDELLVTIHEAHGQKVIDARSYIHILITQVDVNRSSIVTEFCTTSTFQNVSLDNRGIQSILMDGIRRGILDARTLMTAWASPMGIDKLPQKESSQYDPQFSIGVWIVPIDTLELMYLSEMAPTVERAVRQLRLLVPGIRTISANVNRQDKESVDDLLIRDVEADIVRYRTILNQNPSDVKALYGLCSCLIEAKQFEEARIKAHALTQIEPNDVTSWKTLFLSLIQLGEVDEAIEIGEKAIRMKPTDLSLLMGLAGVYFRAGNTAMAGEYYSRLQSLGGLDAI